MCHGQNNGSVILRRVILRLPGCKLDSNIIERASRHIVIGRKNWMVAGSSDGAERAALLISLVGTCKMLDFDPAEYFKDVLLRARLRSATPEACADLTPWQWKMAR